MKAKINDILTKTDITATFTSDATEIAFAKRFAIFGDWTASSYSAAVIASGDIDVENDTFREVGHPLVTGLKVRVTTTGTLPAPLELATDYFVIRVDADTYKLAASLADANSGTQIELEDLGSGNMTVAEEAIAAVTVANTAITVVDKKVTSTAHGFVSGIPVRVTTDGILPTGYAALTTYWTVRVDDDNFKLSDTLAHALAGSDIIDPVDQGNGNHTFTVQAITDSVIASGSIDTLANTFTKAAHGFITGVKVQVTTTTTIPSGLVLLTNYYVIKVDADTFKLASSMANAIAGTAVNLASPGVGNQTVTAEATAATITPQATFTDPNIAESPAEWFAIASAESISGTGFKLWEFVDKAYHSVRLAGTITGGGLTWDADIRAEWTE